MAYIDTKYLGKCETCRHCVGDIKCSTYCDHGEEYSPNLSKIPTADVEEVVRCKDCLYFEYKVGSCGTCEHWHTNSQDIFDSNYCGYAEPRTPKERGAGK